MDSTKFGDLTNALTFWRQKSYLLFSFVFFILN